jgi:hypothetical protein
MVCDVQALLSPQTGTRWTRSRAETPLPHHFPRPTAANSHGGFFIPQSRTGSLPKPRRFTPETTSIYTRNHTVELSSHTVEHSNRTLELSSRTVELPSRTVELSNRTVELSSRTVEHSSRTVEHSSHTVELSSRTVELSSRKVELSNRTDSHPQPHRFTPPLAWFPAAGARRSPASTPILPKQ